MPELSDDAARARAERNRRDAMQRSARGPFRIGGGALLPSMLAGQSPFYGPELQAQNAPQAWDIASQMLAPGSQYQPGGGADFSQAAGALQSQVLGPNPGMANSEFEQGLGQIRQQGQTQQTQLSNTMAGFGGSLDPEAFARASQAIGGQQMQARAGLVAQRAGMNRQSLMGATQALAPYYRGQQQQFGELSGLAGNIMSSGVFKMPSPYGTGVPSDPRPAFTGGF